MHRLDDPIGSNLWTITMLLMVTFHFGGDGTTKVLLGPSKSHGLYYKSSRATMIIIRNVSCVMEYSWFGP